MPSLTIITPASTINRIINYTFSCNQFVIGFKVTPWNFLVSLSQIQDVLLLLTLFLILIKIHMWVCTPHSLHCYPKEYAARHASSAMELFFFFFLVRLSFVILKWLICHQNSPVATFGNHLSITFGPNGRAAEGSEGGKQALLIFFMKCCLFWFVMWIVLLFPATAV